MIDTDLAKLTTNEMMMWGLANLWKEGKEGGYAIKHGARLVNDFPPCNNVDSEDNETNTPNFFEKAFPCLFPWGCGGIEAN